MHNNAKKMVMLFSCTALLSFSLNCFSMEILKTTVGQVFNTETLKIAGVGFASVLGYYAVHYHTAQSLEHAYHPDSDFNELLEDEDYNCLSWKHHAQQALIIGTGTALAARLGPWKQIEYAQLALPAIALFAGTGVSSFFNGRLNYRISKMSSESFIQSYINAKSCMTAIEIILPLSLLYYRSLQK